MQIDLAVFLFKVPDALFDHLFEFAVFCPAFVFCDVAELSNSAWSTRNVCQLRLSFILSSLRDEVLAKF